MTKKSGQCYLTTNCKVGEDRIHLKVSAEGFASADTTLACGSEYEYFHIRLDRSAP